MTDRERLARLLGGEELAWLVARVRRRLERGESLDTPVTLVGATAGQRAAVQRLLGRRPGSGANLTVALPALDETLRRSGACPEGLVAAVIALTGPVTDRQAARDGEERAWQAAYAPVAVACAQAGLDAWFARAVATGVLRRLTGTPESAARVLADLARVIGDLPAAGEPLAGFAARVVGSAHALDDGRPLATLAIGAARALSGIPPGRGAQWRREVWASVGLVRDELSSTVLTLGLRGDPHTATGRALAAWHDVGQPAVLTLRQLLRDPPRLTAPVTYVCENPAVIAAAADHLGPACPPLICTAGQPGLAALHLLRHLASSGTTLNYHGDFDWGGVRIANLIFSRVPARPWRFTTTSYLAAATGGHPLTGTPADACWDHHLTAAMIDTGVAVEEEHVIDDLLTDLTT